MLGKVINQVHVVANWLTDFFFKIQVN